MGDITAHFSRSEFRCKDGTEVPDEYLPNLQRLCEALEVLRATLNAPIKILSGYRTLSYNRKCGGVMPRKGRRGSLHLTAEAADVVVKGHTAKQVYDAANHLQRQNKMALGGLGLYPDRFTHVDVRGRRARWKSEKQ